MAKVISLSDLFTDMLKDICYAEKKILKSLPKMAKAAGKGSKLAEAFSKHFQETQSQVERLNQVFEIIGKKPQGKTCAVLGGLVKEADELMESVKRKEILQAGRWQGHKRSST